MVLTLSCVVFSFFLAPSFFGIVTAPLTVKRYLQQVNAMLIDVREGYRTELFTYLRGNQCAGSGTMNCQVAWSQLGDSRCQAALNNFNALNDEEKSLCPNAKKGFCRFTDYNCVVLVPMPKEDGATATTFKQVPLKKCVEKVRGFAQQCREYRDFIGAKN